MVVTQERAADAQSEASLANATQPDLAKQEGRKAAEAARKQNEDADKAELKENLKAAKELNDAIGERKTTDTQKAQGEGQALQAARVEGERGFTAAQSNPIGIVEKDYSASTPENQAILDAAGTGKSGDVIRTLVKHFDSFPNGGRLHFELNRVREILYDGLVRKS